MVAISSSQSMEMFYSDIVLSDNVTSLWRVGNTMQNGTGVQVNIKLTVRKRVPWLSVDDTWSAGHHVQY